ncbi:MAG: peptidyl-prolyl cis-trans isomerase [Nitrospirota bacterium]
MMYRIILTLTIVLIPLVAAPSFADDVVVARVNGTAITARDLREAVDRLIPAAAFHGTVSEEKRNQYRDKALEDLINQELQYQDALARGMKPDKKLVKVRMKEIREKFPSELSYEQALAQQGVTEDALKARVARIVLIQAVTGKVVDEPSQMKDGDVKEYYDRNSEKFKQPESVKLRIISTKDEKKAKEILAGLKAGRDFGDTAARMSEDDYRIMGGDIGYIHRGRILPEIEQAAFNSLKAGEMSGLLKAKGKWFIIKVEDRKPEHLVSFDEIKEKLKKDIESRRSAELKEKWIAGLREKAKIEAVINTQ